MTFNKVVSISAVWQERSLQEYLLIFQSFHILKIGGTNRV